MDIKDNLLSEFTHNVREIQTTQKSIKPEPESDDNFAHMLSSALEHVNSTQLHAGKMVKAFELGADNVSLLDVKVAQQKSSIVTTATYEVTKKGISAFNEIMRLQF